MHPMSLSFYVTKGYILPCLFETGLGLEVTGRCRWISAWKGRWARCAPDEVNFIVFNDQ